jgi:ABC-2 type transport system permease protein
MQQYSQAKAMLAITKASFKAILKNPGAIFFSLMFPLIFIFIFGSFGDGGMPTHKVAFASESDTANPVYTFINSNPFFGVKKYTDTSKRNTDFIKGRLAAIITIQKKESNNVPNYNVLINGTSASTSEVMQMKPLLENFKAKFEKGYRKDSTDLITIATTEQKLEREYKNIDFVLPGQIGFSMLFATLFGIAFTFYNLREQLVLKRFYASPVNKLNILFGIGISRLAFQLLNVIVLVAIGHYWLKFNLAHGFLTFLEMMVLSILLLIVLMGVGLIFSSIVKNDSVIPLYINLFGFPQMLLSGTFFSVEVFPKWLQTVCQVFPLYHFNTAIRRISFEGAHLTDCLPQIGVLCLWIAVVYFLVYKYFKWE